MRIFLKDETVSLDGLNTRMLTAIQAAAQVWKEQGMQSVTITSALDGDHGTRSLHPSGQAIDLRIWGLPSMRSAAEQVKDLLGPDYDVILETDHLHIEFDPKT